MGRRNVRTITLSTKDIALLRAAIDLYRDKYLRKRDRSPLPRKSPMLAYLRRRLEVLRDADELESRREFYARFQRDLTPVIHVTDGDFMDLVITPLSRAGDLLSRGIVEMASEPPSAVAVDPILDAEHTAAQMLDLQMRVVKEFQGQDPRTVDEMIAARRQPSPYGRRLRRHLLNAADRFLTRLQLMESNSRTALRKLAHPLARLLRGCHILRKVDRWLPRVVDLYWWAVLEQEVPLRHVRLLRRRKVFNSEHPQLAIGDSRILAAMEKRGSTKESMEHVTRLM